MKTYPVYLCMNMFKRQPEQFRFTEDEHRWLHDLDQETAKIEAEQLRELEAQYADEIKRPYDDWNQVWSDERERDKALLGVSAEQALNRLDVEFERNGTKFVFRVQNHFSHDLRLPKKGYVYKGGAARALLMRALRLDSESVPRDIDVSRLDAILPDADLDDHVARVFMPDDYQHGNGVEAIADVETYLSTRDLTVNELYADDEQIVASAQCVLDTVRGILRITDYEKDEYGGAGPKLVAKIVRLYAHALDKDGHMQHICNTLRMTLRLT